MIDDQVHAFTSITSNYLPKARVLAHSLKTLAPQVRFHLMLSDDLPEGFDLSDEPFDSIISLQDLPIANMDGWVFGHTVVELCTAVKPFAFQTIFDRHGAGKVFYFDPDMVVFSRFDELVERLDRRSLLLTPHQCVPETTLEAVADNEIASLKHGVFNLGFLGVRASDEGLRFLDWWAARLEHFCQDDLAQGLFTDQRWIDLVPCFFSDYEVMRDAGFNVATWNLTHRRASGSLAAGVRINDEALGFYHFSGFDSGAQELMLNKYGRQYPVLAELRAWYLAECEKMGQSRLGKLPARYSCFADGTPITKAQRTLYRVREDLRSAFPDPFAVAPAAQCYRDWYLQNGENEAPSQQLIAHADMRFADAAAGFIAFSESRLRQTRRIGGWRKRLAGSILRLSHLAARRFLA